ncbi:hypothetical protein ACOJIV_22860 [Haloarcula sp. AONF1]
MIRPDEFDLRNLLLGSVFLLIVAGLSTLLYLGRISVSLIDIIVSTALTAALIVIYSIQTNLQSDQSELVEDQTEIMQEQHQVQNKQAEVLVGQKKTQDSQTEIMSSQEGIQERQTEILDNQTALMELEYEPEIVIEDCSFTNSQIRVDISNIGRGIAKHLYVHTDVHIGSLAPENRGHDPSTIPENAWHHSEDALFYRDDDGTEYVNGIGSLQRQNSIDTLTNRVAGGSIGSEEVQAFIGTPKVYRYPPGMGATGIRINQLMADLREIGIESVHITFDLIYCNEKTDPTTEDIRVKQITGRAFDLVEYDSLSEFLDMSGPTSGSRQEVIEQISEYPKYPPTNR